MSISQNMEDLYLVADLGLTCCGELERSLNLIEIAHSIGFQAVKFQMLNAEELLGDPEVQYTYPTLVEGPKTERMMDMFKPLEMARDDWFRIKRECESFGLELIITCHVQSAVPLINELDLPYNKICTWSINHYHMIKDLAKNGKPLIIDTGTINQTELIELQTFYSQNGGGEIIVFFDFHTDNMLEYNFNAISQLKSEGFIVGYTPQGRKDWLDYMSIGNGVTILEKRLTMSRNIPLNGHWKAHEPAELKQWVQNVTECYRGLGESGLRPTKDDIAMSKWAYKSARLVRDVQCGQIISNEDFIFQRPGHGVSSKDILLKYVGKKYKRSYLKDDWFDVELD